MVFYCILIASMLGDLLWWRWYDTRFKDMRLTLGRVCLGAWILVVISFLIHTLVRSPIDDLPQFGPLWWHVVGYLWHLVVLPPTLIALWAARVRVRRRGRQSQLTTSATSASPLSGQGTASSSAERSPGAEPSPWPQLSRRNVLKVAASAAVPPLIAAGLTLRAESALREFRVRRTELLVPSLPQDLDGVTIAHVSDLHIGQFLPAGMAQRVAEATNALGADLVAFTGDLIDISADRIAPGIDFIRQLDPRYGLAMVQGNHDGMTDADRFENPIREAGLPLLQDQQRTFRIPGRKTAVQFLGTRWGDLKFGREVDRTGKDANRRFRVRSDSATRQSLANVSALRTAAAFPILLAHHPHDFDPATDAGFPLMLSGHTHGGQLMLNERIGVGPLRFRYWSGVYRRAQSQLVVSNGIGNWFPLRVNAPPEIGLITLRSGRESAPT